MGLGGHLVTINDAAERAWLVTTFGSSPYYWIGFNDIAVEGSWVWVNGELTPYTNWAGGEPNNWWSGEDPAVMNWISRGLWNDAEDFGIWAGIAE